MSVVDLSHAPKRKMEERAISRATEKQIARDLSPAVAWPTIVLAIALPAAFLSLAALGMTRQLPLWACTPALALIAYAHYTLVHESIHGNVVASPRSLTWINTLVGWIGAIGLGIGWPVLQRTHLLHHSHTNTEDDPDIVVKGTLMQLIWKWIKDLPTSLVPMFAAKYISKSGYNIIQNLFSPTEILQSSLVTVSSLALLVLALATGHFADWLLLLFIPQQLAVLILMIFFQWLPHHPFDRTDRYGATRISLWLGGELLTFQQNLHLMHHLWPSVPFYNYGRLFRALRPVLEQEQARIEGFAVGPWRRPVRP